MPGEVVRRAPPASGRARARPRADAARRARPPRPRGHAARAVGAAARSRPSASTRPARCCAPPSTSAPTTRASRPTPSAAARPCAALEADLLRYVEHAAHGRSAFAPREFELRFGGPEDPLGPAELAGGELRLQGRIDRIDVSADGGEAIVYDYKGKGAPPQAKWLDESRLQVGLYLLALPQLLGLEAVGGLYQPLGRDDDGRPRGLLLDDADPGWPASIDDRLAPSEFEALLDEVLEAALRGRARHPLGRAGPRPDACAYRGGCAHPTICRCEAASA